MDAAKIAIVMLHPGCNMTCRFCVSEETFSPMDWGQAVLLLDLLKRCGIGNVVFGGGEPFTWEHDVIRLARVAKQRGFFTQVGTNGIWMPEGIERGAAFDRFILPLEAADADLHNSLRRFRRQHHEIVIDRLERLRRAGKSVTVSTVVTQENIGALPELGVWLRDYQRDGGNLHAWHLYKFVPEGRGGRLNAAQLSIDDTAYDAACDQVRSIGFGITIFKRPNMFRSRTVCFFWYQGNRLQVVDPPLEFRRPADTNYMAELAPEG